MLKISKFANLEIYQNLKKFQVGIFSYILSDRVI